MWQRRSLPRLKQPVAEVAHEAIHRGAKIANTSSCYPDDFIDEDNPIRVVDVFVDELDLLKLTRPGLFDSTHRVAGWWPRNGDQRPRYATGLLLPAPPGARCRRRDARRDGASPAHLLDAATMIAAHLMWVALPGGTLELRRKTL